MPDEQAGTPSTFLQIIKIFAWPILVLVIVLLFWSSLNKLINAVPDVLASADTVTVGKLSLRVGKLLSDQANQEVRDALSGMTSDDVTTIMENDVGSTTCYAGGNFGDYAKQWDRLGRLGVVHVLNADQVRKQQKMNQANDKYLYCIEATARYDKLRKFLYGVLNDAISNGVHEAFPPPEHEQKH